MQAQLSNPISGQFLEGFTRTGGGTSAFVSHVHGRFTLTEVYPARESPGLIARSTSDENVFIQIVYHAYCLDHELARLADEWRRTRSKVTSSPTKLAMHPAYQRIMAKGWPAVPFILQELQREPDHWFWALSAITEVDPVQVEDRGDFNAMTEAWIKWGREGGYI